MAIAHGLIAHGQLQHLKKQTNPKLPTQKSLWLAVGNCTAPVWVVVSNRTIIEREFDQ